LSAVKDRFVYGTLLLTGVLGILWADVEFNSTTGFLFLSSLFGVVSWIEFRRMSGARIRILTPVGAGIIVTVLVVEWAFASDLLPRHLYSYFLIGVGVATPLFAVVLSLRSEPTRERVVEIAIASLGVIYLSVPLLIFLKLRQSPEGEWWVVLAVLVVKANDIGGYLVGRQFGRTQLSRLSPNKTVEGSIGGLCLGVAAGYGIFASWLSGDAGVPWIEVTTLALIVGVCGQLGDLVESLFKRGFGVKDSGALVPAFGGTLDMIDSILFGAPAVYLCRKCLEL